MTEVAKDVRPGSVRAQPLRLSLPGEHGAYLTLLGAAVAALLVAPRSIPVLAVAWLMAATFLARGWADRLAARHPLRAWDRLAIALETAVAVAALAWLAREPVVALLAGGFAAVTLVASALARRMRRHRDPRVELVGLGGLGASAGLAAWASGTAVVDALILGGVLAAHAATAVYAVRPALGKRGKLSRPTMGYLWLAAVAVGCVALGRPLAALALVPRLALLALRPAAATASQVGIRETFALAAAVALVVVA